MRSILPRLRAFMRSDDGPTAVEYAVLLAVIIVAAVGGLSLFGVHMGNLYTMIDATVPVAS